jgi:hypothetical protein
LRFKFSFYYFLYKNSILSNRFTIKFLIGQIQLATTSHQWLWLARFARWCKPMLATLDANVTFSWVFTGTCSSVIVCIPVLECVLPALNWQSEYADFL